MFKLQPTLNPIHPNFSLGHTLTTLVRLTTDTAKFFLFPGIWFFNFLRLVIFVIIMFPALFPVLLYYLWNDKILKNLVYGQKFRNQLDVYLPKTRDTDEKLPVVIFVTGGAWIIGYKLWGWLMGKAFHENGVICVCPDYRNFPQTDVNGMVEDIVDALIWVEKNIESLGGDLENVSLMGQSAGAHLTSLVMMHRDCPIRLRRWVGISGVYNPEGCTELWERKGLSSRLIERIFGEDKSTTYPVEVLKNIDVKERLPPTVILMHGTADETAPPEQTKEFEKVLQSAGVSPLTMYWSGKSHTDLILEDAVTGDDPLMTYLLRLVLDDQDAEVYLPSMLNCAAVQAARYVNPF